MTQLALDLAPTEVGERVKRDPNCSKCGLCESAETVCLLGVGDRKAKIMIIGEAPGQREDEEGEPFVGKSGDLLTDWLHLRGVERDEVYITNAVHCRPPNNRTPSKKEMRACKSWLMAEIQVVQPEFILSLGNVPLEVLTGEKGIKKKRGYPIEVPGSTLGVSHKTVIIFPTFHPSYALHDPRAAPVIERDIHQFLAMVRRGGLGKESGLNYKIVTRDNLEEALEDIDDEDVISVDTETSGLNVFEPGFWCTSLGVGTSTTQWTFPLNHRLSPLYKKPNAQRRLVSKVIRRIKTSKVKKTIVMANGKFDTKVLKTCFDEMLRCDHDVMLGSYSLDENQFHGLDHIAARYFNAMDYDIPMSDKHGITGTLERHCRYLGQDLMWTRKSYYKQVKELEADPLTKRIFDHVTMPASHMYTDVELHGVPVSVKKLEESHKYWSEKRDAALVKLNKMFPDKRTRKDKKTKQIITGINWNSPQQVAEILFGKLKLKPLDETPGGDPSVSESVLLRLSGKSVVPKLILEYREAAKMVGTFVEGWQRMIVDGLLHPTFKIHGTVTGRPSCEDPNFQQTPRDPRIRSLVCADEYKSDGHKWVMVEMDESQAEMRIAAELSGDGELRLSYQTGQDVHTLTVQRIFGIMKPTSEERKRAKAVNFGFLYGMGWKKFIDYARDKYGVTFSPAEAKRIRKAFFRLYSGLPDWHKRQRNFAAKHGYVRNIIGRKRRLPDAQLAANDNDKHGMMRMQEAFRQAINSPVQSLASDFNLLAAIQLWRTLPVEHFRIVATIHDAILMLIRADKVEQYLPILKSTLEWPDMLAKWKIRMSVPMVADIKIGAWGSGVERKDIAKKRAA
jgi:uracil-DNA glycosylase family 4